MQSGFLLSTFMAPFSDRERLLPLLPLSVTLPFWISPPCVAPASHMDAALSPLCQLVPPFPCGHPPCSPFPTQVVTCWA